RDSNNRTACRRCRKKQRCRDRSPRRPLRAGLRGLSQDRLAGDRRRSRRGQLHGARRGPIARCDLARGARPGGVREPQHAGGPRAIPCRFFGAAIIGRHPLKIVVTVKQVPDPNSNFALESDNTISREKEAVLDPGDECGVEEGLQLKESLGGEVILVSMGPERAKDAIRKGLSMGADRGVLISDAALAGADALLTAKALAAAIKQEQPDLVICATESYDGSTGMVPPMLAELLGMPQLTFAKKVEVDGSSVKVHRQTADGYQVVETATPALITVTAAIAEPRYASLKGIMAARSKEIKQVSLGDLGVEKSEPAETIEGVVDAETRKAGEVIEDDGSAVERIAKVLAEATVI